MARPWVRTGSRSRMAQASRWGRPPSPITFSGQVSQKGTPWPGQAATASRWGRRRPRPTPAKRPWQVNRSCAIGTSRGLLLLLAAGPFLLVLAAAALFLALLILLHVRAAAATATAAAPVLGLALGLLGVFGFCRSLRLCLGVLGTTVTGLAQGRLRAEGANGRGGNSGGTACHQRPRSEEGGDTDEFRDHRILLRAHPRQEPPRGPGNPSMPNLSRGVSRISELARSSACGVQRPVKV